MLFVFDWDGTLSDSADRIISCVQAAIDALNMPVRSDEQIKNIIGLGLQEALVALYPEMPEKNISQFKKEYVRHFVQHDISPSPFFPGVLDALERLRADGHKLTVATGKSRQGLDRVLSRLDMQGFFHSTRCADETASKPSPRMLEELLAEFAEPVENAVMIGDTEYDMSMAQQANVSRIAVSYGAHHIDRLRSYNPVLCADHFSEILDWHYSN